MKHRIKYSMILLACLLLVGNKNLAYAKGIEESLFSETKKGKGEYNHSGFRRGIKEKGWREYNLR